MIITSKSGMANANEASLIHGHKNHSQKTLKNSIFYPMLLWHVFLNKHWY